MEQKEESKIVEVNGVKMELDYRTAKMSVVDTFKVGDSVKLLKNETYGTPTVKFGVIVGFEEFKSLPTIVVLYLEYSEMKYAYINKDSKNEIIKSQEHDLVSEKNWILDRMKSKIEKAEVELANEKRNYKLFMEQFGKFFENKEEKENVV